EGARGRPGGGRPRNQQRDDRPRHPGEEQHHDSDPEPVGIERSQLGQGGPGIGEGSAKGCQVVVACRAAQLGTVWYRQQRRVRFDGGEQRRGVLREAEVVRGFAVARLEHQRQAEQLFITPYHAQVVHGVGVVGQVAVELDRALLVARALRCVTEQVRPLRSVRQVLGQQRTAGGGG